MKQHYIEKRFSAESQRIIGLVNEVLDSYAAQGYDLSLRQLYYQLVARGHLENSQRSYKNLGNLVSDARLAGLVDWAMIKDRGRVQVRPSHWGSPADIMDSAAYSFRIDKWLRQPNRVVVLVEKQALEGVLIPVCRELDVAFMANKGYCVDPSTRVLTTDLRWLRADEVETGMSLVGVDENVPGSKKQRRMRRAVVSSVARFISPRMLVETDHGPITVSANHPFLVTRRNLNHGHTDGWNNGWFWVRADKIRDGDRVARLCTPWVERYDYDAGWLAGLYDGEGCLTNASRIGALFATVYQSPGDVLDRARGLLKEYGAYSSENISGQSGVVGLKTYGIDSILTLFGSIRPGRMLQTFQSILDAGTGPAKARTPAVVLSCTPLLDGPVIGIETSTGTLITEGFVSHNSSSSSLYELGKELMADWRGGKWVKVMYLGDHDPSGIDMTRDVRERLHLFAECDTWRLEVKRLALNYDQVEVLQPPPNPAKEADSRFEGYLAEYGDTSWELDAIEPAQLASIVREAVIEERDQELWDEDVEREEEMRNTLKNYAREYRDEHGDA